MEYKIYNIKNEKSFQNNLLLEQQSHHILKERNGKGNDFLGWLDLPDFVSEEYISKIQNIAKEFSKKDVVVIIGIGGSYLGAKAVIEALKPQFAKNKPEIIFAGHTLSEDYYSELLDYLKGKNFAVVIISKSGTTTEPAIAFRLLQNEMKNIYPPQFLRDNIIAITDKNKGALKTIATDEGYRTFVIPDDVGGRFSVLTAVGLLPIAIAGFNIKKLIAGAKASFNDCNSTDIEKNAAIRYAAFRNYLYSSGKKIEILANFNFRLNFIAEWWKQLYGESEGKENKGLFPASVSFTTDLHSMGQYIQQGERIIFETVIDIKQSQHHITIGKEEDNADGLNFLSGKTVGEINRMAMIGTRLAHIDGGVPNIVVEVERLDAFNLGELFYFFEFACGISGYILGVNPFNQPGVENYKKNMFALLNKPGYEEESANILERIKHIV